MHRGEVARRALGACFVLDGVTKVIQPAPLGPVVAHLGFTPALVALIGVILIGSATLYLIPRTAPVGAVLMTGYFGGALAAHARVGDPAWTYVAVGGFGLLIWFALYQTDARVRALFDLRGSRRAD